jgi:hypothetical protein
MRSSDASGPKKPPLCHEKACIEPAITRAAGVKTLHQTQVAIAESVGRFVAAAFWPVGLFDQARVMDQYRFTAICNEWQIDIAPAKAVMACIPAIAGRRAVWPSLPSARRAPVSTRRSETRSFRASERNSFSFRSPETPDANSRVPIRMPYLVHGSRQNFAGRRTTSIPALARL